MNTTTIPANPHNTTDSVDEDLAEQALPGHGVPSQDPEAAAQHALSPEESERESRSAFMGGGTMAGAAAGAAVGVAVGGPLGVVVGGTVGAVAGALGGAAAGQVAHPDTAQTETLAPDPAQRVAGDTDPRA